MCPENVHCWHQNFQQTHQYCEKAEFNAAIQQICVPTPLTVYIIAMFKRCTVLLPALYNGGNVN
jgi:hypothetical protein